MGKNEQIIHVKNGRKIGFEVYGDLKGQPLFFFHGWPNSRLHGEILDSVAKKLHIQVISPDRPGYGISEYQKGRQMLDWPDDVIAIADALKLKKFAVLGNSGGGPYAAACTYKIPHRITRVGIVVGLAPTNVEGILTGMAYLNKLGWRNYRRFPFLIPIISVLLDIRIRWMPGLIKFDFNSSTDKEIISQASLPDIIRRRKEAFRQGIKGPALDLHLYSKDYGFPLDKITKKVFLWYGEADKKVSPQMGKYYASQLPNAQFTLYANEGHMILNNHTEEILNTLIS